MATKLTTVYPIPVQFMFTRFNRGVFLLGYFVCALSGACQPSIRCTTDEECERGSEAGVCLKATMEAKYCAFATTECESRLRWDASAGDNLGGQCLVTNVGCALDSCENGGVCSETAAGLSCTCPSGFVGDRCEINVDDCTPNPCQNGGACTDLVNDTSCACPSGFAGKNCEIVLLAGLEISPGVLSPD